MLLTSSWAWLISFSNLEICLSIACLLYLSIEDISTLLLFISSCIVLILSPKDSISNCSLVNSLAAILAVYSLSISLLYSTLYRFSAYISLTLSILAKAWLVKSSSDLVSWTPASLKYSLNSGLVIYSFNKS